MVIMQIKLKKAKKIDSELFLLIESYSIKTLKNQGKHPYLTILYSGLEFHLLQNFLIQ